jgi:hypothetical protein
MLQARKPHYLSSSRIEHSAQIGEGLNVDSDLDLIDKGEGINET